MSLTRLTSFVAKKTRDSRGTPNDLLDVSKDEWNLDEEDNDLTDPSFLPMGSSRNTPDHSPGPRRTVGEKISKDREAMVAGRGGSKRLMTSLLKKFANLPNLVSPMNWILPGFTPST